MNELTLTSNHQIALLEHETNMLRTDDISITVHNGIRTVEGYNKNGEKVVIETIISSNYPSDSNGFRQKNISVCDKLSPSERKGIVKDLKDKQNYTQVEIAKKLGVSQKTVSNDLKSTQLKDKKNDKK